MALTGRGVEVCPCSFSRNWTQEFSQASGDCIKFPNYFLLFLIMQLLGAFIHFWVGFFSIFWEDEPREGWAFPLYPTSHLSITCRTTICFLNLVFLQIRKQLSVLCPESGGCSALPSQNLALFCSLEEWKVWMFGKTGRCREGISALAATLMQ